MQAVGQLDQDYTHVPRHRQQHFAEVLGLGFLERLIFNPVNFGNTINQFGGDLAKVFCNLRLGDRRVFHHVVQQRSNQCLRVKMPTGKIGCHRQRMRNVGFAGDPQLSFVGSVGKVIGGNYTLQVFRFEISGDARFELIKRSQQCLCGSTGI